MLVKIIPLATEANSVIVLHPSDSVAVARVPLSPGQTVEAGGVHVAASATVPAGHKIALKPIRTGEPVLRYGEIIGFASQDIAAGEHVHEHNLGFEELAHQVTFDTKPPTPVSSTRSFLG